MIIVHRSKDSVDYDELYQILVDIILQEEKKDEQTICTDKSID